MSFPRYPKYKASGAEWLAGVPSHWTVLPLKRALRLITDKAVERENPVALENVESWTGRLIRSAPTEFDGDGTAFERGDVLFGKLRPYLAKVFVADGRGEAVGDFHVMRATRQDLEPSFVQAQMLTRAFIDVVNGSTFGAKMPRASWEALGAMPVVVPPRSEQHAILAFLNRETAKIDALVAEQQRLNELLREKRQAVISHAVTKGLNPATAMKDSGSQWLGRIPAHWTVIKMKWVAKMESGHTPDKKVSAYWDGEVSWVSLNDTGYLKDHDYITETAFKITEEGMANSSAHLLPARTVVFSRDATIGRCAITTKAMAVSQHFIGWVCGEVLVPEFLLLRLRSMGAELDSLTTGATLKTIGMPEVRTLVTTLPPTDEQRAIVEHVCDQTATLDVLMAEAQRGIALLQERRAALISAAVTGQIDVRSAAARSAA